MLCSKFLVSKKSQVVFKIELTSSLSESFQQTDLKTKAAVATEAAPCEKKDSCCDRSSALEKKEKND